MFHNSDEWVEGNQGSTLWEVGFSHCCHWNFPPENNRSHQGWILMGLPNER